MLRSLHSWFRLVIRGQSGQYNQPILSQYCGNLGKLVCPVWDPIHSGILNVTSLKEGKYIIPPCLLIISLLKLKFNSNKIKTEFPPRPISDFSDYIFFLIPAEKEGGQTHTWNVAILERVVRIQMQQGTCMFKSGFICNNLGSNFKMQCKNSYIVVLLLPVVEFGFWCWSSVVISFMKWGGVLRPDWLVSVFHWHWRCRGPIVIFRQSD